MPYTKKVPTPQELRAILSVRYYCSSTSFRHYDEILPGIFLGDVKSAKNIFNLEKMGITHVLNAAYTPSPYTDRETSDAYYQERNFSCSFMGIPAQDFPSFKIDAFFDDATNFIHEALKTNGKVLVHCQVGISRSATIVIAYLMLKKKMTAIEAVSYVGSIRPIFPNEGFLKQLCELDHRVRFPSSYALKNFSNMTRGTICKIFGKH